MLTPNYANPRAMEPPKVFKALRAFVLAYALPRLDEKCVFQGWQNRAALPKSNEYAVISVFDSTRRGSDTHELLNTAEGEDKPEIYRAKAYYETRAQLDFISQGEAGRQRALCIDVAAHSSLGVNFFRPYGLALEYADGARDLTFTDEAQQYVRRFMVSLMLGHWATLDVETAWIGMGKTGPAININIKGARNEH